ncbi:MAG: hypothetical protein ACE5IP_05645 [Terriglobia bacterium]
MRGSIRIGWFLLILLGMLVSIPSPAHAQFVPTTPPPVSGRPLTVDGILPADVLGRAELLRDELELIRFEMGQPKEERTEIAVTGVSPREVIFQALTLYRKTNQLRFEVAGELGFERQVTLPRDIQPLHVWRVVDAAYERVLVVRRKLGITRRVEEKLRDPATTPAAAFRAIVQANRELDLLIRQQISTNDVFQQVTLATHYAARLLEEFPQATSMPASPGFERGQTPIAVYNRLLECYARAETIMERSRIEVLKLEPAGAEAAEERPTEIDPSDVFDIATLLVSELAYLHVQLQYTEPPTQAYDPGFKVPAHVYQRAGILLRQLADLENLVEANPNWLTSRQPSAPER